MTNLEQLQSMSLEALVEWLDKYGNFDGAPWSIWFDENYCSKCETINYKFADAPPEDELGFKPMWISDDHPIECAYCELEKKCKYFTTLDDTPSNADVIKMWLSKEAK
jgi:hypothetical protein